MSMELELTIQDYWHAGSGVGRGASSDAEPVRTRMNLPYLPGRTLKGLLRDAVLDASLSALEEVRPGDSVRLFGAPLAASEEQKLLGSYKVTDIQSSLHVTDAVVPGLEDTLVEELGPDEGRMLAGTLFRRISSTSMRDGIALPHTLRTVTAAVPLTLRATVVETSPIDFDWKGIIRFSLPFLRALGSYRHRGFGRVIAEEVLH